MRHPKNSPYPFKRLRQYPGPVMTIRCGMCPHREGRYRLSRLVQAYGPDKLLDDVLDVLVRCKWHRKGCSAPPQKYAPKCHAHCVEMGE